MHQPDTADYLALFGQYRSGGTSLPQPASAQAVAAMPDAADAPVLAAALGGHDFGRAYLEPEDERYRLLFDQMCRLLLLPSPFNLQMPQEFRRTARLYLDGDPATLAHMRTAQMRHFMLSDLYDYVHLCHTMGRARW